MDWNLLLLLAQIIALISLAALAMYLITVLIRVRSLLTIVEQDVRELTSRAIPVFENLEAITDKVKHITESIDDQVDGVRHSIDTIKQIADNISDFERRIQARIEEPVMETVGTFSAIVKGIQAFYARLRTQPSRAS